MGIKNKAKIAKSILTDSKRRFDFLTRIGVYNFMSDEKFLKKKYRIELGKELDLENPKTFSEKLQWLKLYDRKKAYIKLVDKYEVKQIVAEIIGQEYIVPTLGVWDVVEDIEFDNLPKQFVLKCTHDSGGLVICKDRESMNCEEVKKKIRNCQKRNYFFSGREWPYKNVNPRIIAEKYISDISRRC